MAKAARGKKAPRQVRKPRTPKSKIADVSPDHDLRRTLFFNLYDRSRPIEDVLCDVNKAYFYLVNSGKTTEQEPVAEAKPEPLPAQPEVDRDEIPTVTKSRFETERLLM